MCNHYVMFFRYHDFICIFFSDDTYRKVGKELLHQLSTVGFAYLKNPGIDENLQNKFNEITNEFFLCPLQSPVSCYPSPFLSVSSPLPLRKVMMYNLVNPLRRPGPYLMGQRFDERFVCEEH